MRVMKSNQPSSGTQSQSGSATSTEARSHWSNRMAFILAAAGSAVGLGNIWKFPYITGVNGGGAFVLVYLACIAAVGVPIFIAELYIGQQSQKNAVEAFEHFTKKKTLWRWIGIVGVFSSFLILSFYSVVGGWVLDFLTRSLMGQFTSSHSESEIKGHLGTLFSSPMRQLFWHTIFMGVTVAIVLRGVKAGIEKWARILMPALFVLLGLLFLRVIFLDGFGQALKFLFSPDTSKLTGAGVLEAVGHSFFTLSLGMGCMITYGSYLTTREDLTRTAFTVAILDTVVALIAGIVVFTIVFTYGLEAGAGPTLLFQTLPVLFSKMTGGYLIAVAFFLLVTFAALTSSVSLLEVPVVYWAEANGKNRRTTTILMGITAYVVGILSALSTNILANVKMLGMTFFDLFDKLTSSLFLPAGGLFIALFLGWVLGPKACEAIAASERGSPYRKAAAQGLLWTCRVMAPSAVAIMLFQGLSALLKH